MSHFVRDSGIPDLDALGSAPTQVHVVFANWLDQSEMLCGKLEAEVQVPVHVTWYLGAPRAEADVYSLSSPEDLITALGKHAQVMRVTVERRDGKRV